jgi:hypothetical protein
MSTYKLPPAAMTALFDYPTTQAYLGGLSRSTIKTLASTGLITRVNIGSRTLFLKASLDEYIQRLQGCSADGSANGDPT